MAATVRGGGETFDLEMARHLRALGHTVVFLTNIPVFGRAKLPVPGAVLVRSPMFPWFPWDRVKGGWRVRVWEFRQFERRAARWIRRHAAEFDVIQVCELPYLVSRLKVEGSKFKDQGTTDSDSQSFNPPPSTMNHQPSTNPFPPIVMRLTAPNAHDPWGGIGLADALIASGTSIEKIRRAIRPDVHDVPNGVDVGRFQGGKVAREQGDVAQACCASAGRDGRPSQTNHQAPSTKHQAPSTRLEFRQKLGIPSAAQVALYVARFQAFKQHGLLVEAVRRAATELPDLHLVLAGSGPLQGDIQAQVRAAGLQERVHYLGEVDFDAIPEVYASADIKVISSEYESFCFAAIEAMAAGLPVVTTDCGWVPTLIGDPLPPLEKQWAHGGDEPGRFEVEVEGRRIRSAPGGLVVSRTDAASLANAILSMLKDPELAKLCGAWNQAKAEREHGWERSARKLVEVYQALLMKTTDAHG